jgi:hypothetical protein
MIENCDMCGTKIIGGKCSCGIWKTTEEMEDDSMKKAIEHFHEMKRFTFTADMPHLGCAVAFFRGDYSDCRKVEKFIFQMKNRPFYRNEE